MGITEGLWLEGQNTEGALAPPGPTKSAPVADTQQHC